MNDKTYTLTELVNNLRKAHDDGHISNDPNELVGLVYALGYSLTDESYDQFEADMTAAGL